MAFATAAASLLPLPKLSVPRRATANLRHNNTDDRSFQGRHLRPGGPSSTSNPNRIDNDRRRRGGAVTGSASAEDASTAAADASAAAPSEVYVAAIPLVGLEAMGAILGDRYPGRLEHTLVLVRHADGGGGGGGVTAYDFLPLDPQSPVTAATLLSGGSVPGELRVRPLRGLPSRRCWKVGDTAPGLGLSAEMGAKAGSGGEGVAKVDAREGVDEAAKGFQDMYDARLSLAGNSCREHTAAMAAFLTGVEGVKMPEDF